MQYLSIWLLINSDPLSESIPEILNGNLSDITLMAPNTWTWALFLQAAAISHEVAIFTKFRLCIKSPELFPPSWATRSASTNPGFVSSQLAKVLIGIDFFKSAPGRVPFLPFPSLWRSFSGFSSLSIVEAEILSSFSLTWVRDLSLYVFQV